MERQSNEIDLIKLLRAFAELLTKHKGAFVIIFLLVISFATFQKINEKPNFVYELVIQSEVLEPMIAYNLMYPVGEAVRKKEIEVLKEMLGTNFSGLTSLNLIKVEPLVTTKTYKKGPVLQPDTVYYTKLIVKTNQAIETDSLQKVLLNIWLQSNLLKAERDALESARNYQSRLIKEKSESDSLLRISKNTEEKAWYFKKSLITTAFLIDIERQLKMFGDGLLVVKPFSPNVIPEPTKSWTLYGLMALFTTFVFFGLYVFFYELVVKVRQS